MEASVQKTMKRRPKFTMEEQQAIVKRYQEGVSIKDISDEFNSAENSIGNVLRRMNVQRTRKDDKCAMLKEKRDIIANRLLSGKTGAEVTREFGVSTAYVCSIKKDLGMHQRKRTVYTPEMDARILELRKSGMSYLDIAMAMGVSDDSHIAKVCMKAKLNKPDSAICSDAKSDKKNEIKVVPAPIAEPKKEKEIEAMSETSNTQSKISNSDYAKGYLNGDPRFSRTNLAISKTISISSIKTGYKYSISGGEDCVAIDLGESIVLIPMEKFSDFADELVDVLINIDDFMRREVK